MPDNIFMYIKPIDKIIENFNEAYSIHKLLNKFKNFELNDKIYIMYEHGGLEYQSYASCVDIDRFTDAYSNIIVDNIVTYGSDVSVVYNTLNLDNKCVAINLTSPNYNHYKVEFENSTKFSHIDKLPDNVVNIIKNSQLDNTVQIDVANNKNWYIHDTNIIKRHCDTFSKKIVEEKSQNILGKIIENHPSLHDGINESYINKNDSANDNTNDNTNDNSANDNTNDNTNDNSANEYVDNNINISGSEVNKNKKKCTCKSICKCIYDSIFKYINVYDHASSNTKLLHQMPFISYMVKEKLNIIRIQIYYNTELQLMYICFYSGSFKKLYILLCICISMQDGVPNPYKKI